MRSAYRVSTDNGILLVAHTKKSYWTEVATLCRSIRLTSPGIPVALATDFDLPEKAWRTAGFSHLVRADFSTLAGVAFKVRLNSLSPFTGKTLFLDSDCVCYRDITGVFDAFAGESFVAIGYAAQPMHWFDDLIAIQRRFGVEDLPFIIGDFYLFDRSFLADNIFAEAERIAHDYRSYGIRPIGKWANDEPAFSLAMIQHGINATPGAGEWIARMHNQSLRVQSLDFTKRCAAIELEGSFRSPAIIHFGVFRTQPIYCEQKFLVNYGDSLGRAALPMATAIGQVESFFERGRRRINKLLAQRTGSGGALPGSESPVAQGRSAK